jgi:hypothetical protein
MAAIIVLEKYRKRNPYFTDADFYQQTVTVSDAAKPLSGYIGASQSEQKQTRKRFHPAARVT